MVSGGKKIVPCGRWVAKGGENRSEGCLAKPPSYLVGTGTIQKGTRKRYARNPGKKKKTGTQGKVRQLLTCKPQKRRGGKGTEKRKTTTA